MFLIIIHVFQMDIICILMKYYFHGFNHNSCISNGHYLHFNEYLFMFLIIIHVFQMDIICILMKCDSKHENIIHGILWTLSAF